MYFCANVNFYLSGINAQELYYYFKFLLSTFSVRILIPTSQMGKMAENLDKVT